MERIKDNWADISMALIIVIWGLHFIVLKDAISIFGPVTFNALRFSVGAVFLLMIASRTWAVFRLTRRDLLKLLLISMFGPVGYQALFVLGLDRTTATNTALLVATMPTWTAVFSIFMGMIKLNRLLLFGLVVTLSGVVLVVLGGAESGVSLSEDDLVGSGMLLFGAMLLGFSAVLSKSLVDRYGGIPVGIWSHWFTALGMVILAFPDLITLTPSDFPVRLIPNLFYSALLAGVGGYLTFNNALRVLGPTRAAAYNNFTPLAAAIFGVLILDEPVTLLILIGGTMVLVGVSLVRVFSRVRTTPVMPMRLTLNRNPAIISADK